MKALRFFLYPFSIVYNCITAIRNGLYSLKVLPSYRSEITTISVGNLSMGGTGKSPCVEYLMRLALRNRWKPAVLSRGYKRKSRGQVVADRESTVVTIGDEPLQFFQKFPYVPIVVDSNRKQGMQYLEKQSVDIVFLDDALQDRSISPSFHILLSEYSSLFTEDHVVPTGNLRENRLFAKRADVIVVTKCPKDLVEEQKQRIERRIRRYHTSAPVFFSSIVYRAPKSLFSGDPTTDVSCNHAIVITGIAKPTPFVQYIRTLANTVQHHKYPDHYRFKKKDIQRLILNFSEIQGSNKKVFVTEKDAMRLLPFRDLLQSIEIVYYPIEMDFLFGGKTQFDKLIQQAATAENSTFAGKE